MNNRDEFAAFQAKITRRFCGGAALSVAVVTLMYLLLWKRRMGNVVVALLERVLGFSYDEAYVIYYRYFSNLKEVFFVGAVSAVFLLLLWRLFRWMSRYFGEIDRGIDDLLADGETRIRLSPEMLPFEIKLNEVKGALERRKAEIIMAEKRKDELVMYLAHDIRTPLTSVIGYLSLMSEAPDMTPEQRARSLKITLDKAYRLEDMINEFFEITRYNSQQIALSRGPVDLGLLLIQLADEMSPVLSRRGSSISLRTDGDLTIEADADKLARVFGNIIKNAASYSFPGTGIEMTAVRRDNRAIVSFKNKGPEIPADKLDALFDKFYRLDTARGSNTGGTGLGLAIAREIVLLHGGSIRADSRGDEITFTVELPAG